MNPQDERKVEELFEIAAHLRLDEREAFYERHCHGQPELRAELESLLAHDDQDTKGFLVSPVHVAGQREATRIWPTEQATESASTDDLERIGRYLVQRKIGEGGMGTVYLAEQRHPVRREVALKLIRSGMDSSEVLTRFAREREVLELMDHPGISRILDGGATESGRPYFVMEYTPGLPIDRYCAEHELDVKARILLFIQVCEAVQYAHQKGIIHRDLKPGNVLVMESERGPQAKVIDFGIAATVSAEDADAERATRAQQVLGTRHYMSPEQATPGLTDVDTRSDVYSLGVMLYDLLVGVLPFESQEPPGSQETTPLAPSRRVSKLGEASAKLAVERSTSPRAHAKRLSGDLDWITMKAMEWDPARRYGAASELSSDLRRHLAHEPVLAGPPELSYVLSKFLRRHRTMVAAASLAGVALLVGTIGLGWGLIEAAKQRDDAIESRRQEEIARGREQLGRQRAEEALAEAEAAREARERALEVAERKSADALAVTDFLVDTVALADLELSLNPDLTLENMLRRAGERVGDSFATYPEGEAAVRGALGRALRSMGNLRDAEVHLQRALDIETGLVSTPREQLYASMRQLSQLHSASDSPEHLELDTRAHELALTLVSEASALLGEQLEAYNDQALFGESAPSLEQLEELRLTAEEELEQHSPTWLVLADTLEFLGLQLVKFGEELQVFQLLEQTLQIRRDQLPANHPSIARTLGLLVDTLIQHGRPARAEGFAREVIEIYESVLPADHWLVAEARSILGETRSYQGHGEEAQALLVESHRLIVAAHGLASQAGVASAHRLVSHFTLYGDPDSAAAYRIQLAEALAGSKNQPWRWGAEQEAFGPEHSGLLFALFELRQALHTFHGHDDTPPDMRGYEAALEALRLEWEISVEPSSPLSLIIARWLSSAPFFPGELDPDLVRELQVKLLTVLEPHQLEFPRGMVACWLNLHDLESLAGNIEQAEAHLNRALETARSVPPQPSELRITVERKLANLLASQERFFEAEATLLTTWEESAAYLGLGHAHTRLAMESLLQLYDRWGLPRRAQPCLLRHLSGSTAKDLDSHRIGELVWFVVRTPDFSSELYELALSAARRALELAPGEERSHSLLGMSLCRLKRFEEAQVELERCEELNEALAARHTAFRVLTLVGLGQEQQAAELLEQLEAVAEGLHLESRRLFREAKGHLDESD